MLAALAALSLAPATEAQGFRVTGRVVRVTERDSVPLPGQWAVLHEVTPAGGGPVDSARTDAAGRYALRAAARDTLARYLVSVSYAGIANFTEPLRFPSVRSDTAGVLAVYDTSSVAPPIRLSQRHLVVREREADGSRRVIELWVLENAGRRTRVAPDTTRPVWQGLLPAGAIQFEVGESDMSDRAVFRHGDTVSVAAPVPPGERQLLVSYLMPRTMRELVIPFDQPVGRVNVMLEDTTATVEGPVTLSGVEELERLLVRRYEGEKIAGGAVVVRFGQAPFSPAAYWWVPVLIAALAMAGSLVWWWRRTQAAPVAADDPQVLAAQIAALDAAFTDVDSDEYRRRRAELKDRLSRVLKEREP